ncbi:hypothetical protein LG315_00220 [Microbacterium marinum]|uniref:hypothetical protein n=1 Tax=Microbacterium marinum TaxID=421115 RepID=UPI00384DDAE2
MVYSKSGTTVVAAMVEGRGAIIEGALYWAPVSGVIEARYLTAVLNSQALMTMVAKYQATGLFGARHIDKNLFNAPIPEFDGDNKVHHELANLAELAEQRARDVVNARPATAGFQAVRRLVRASLENAGLSAQIDQLVLRVLAPVT